MLFLDAVRTARASSGTLPIRYRLPWCLRLYRGLRRGHGERLAPRIPDCIAIILSYKRPQNIAPIVNLLLKAPSVSQVIISNNNPAVNLRSWMPGDARRVTLIEQDTPTACHVRYHIALEQQSHLFLAVDDDVFLRPSQVETLCAALRADPSRPFGIFGSIYDERRDAIQLDVRRPGDVDILNQAYVFTAEHARRFAELTRELGFGPTHEAWKRSSWDDLVISHSGRAKPRICDVGAYIECPTGSEPGIAAWMDHEFFSERLSLFRRLRAINPLSQTTESTTATAASPV